MSEVINPYDLYFAHNGRPVEAGSLYVGEAGLDPQLHPIDLFYDEALTVPAAQPINVSGGYLWSHNTPARIYSAATSYSMKVLDKNDVQVFYDQDIDVKNLELASEVKYTAPFTGAVERSVANKLAERISVKDFGAIGDGNSHPLAELYPTLSAAQAAYTGVGVTSLTQQVDWAATQAAINAATANNKAVDLCGLNLILNDKLSCTANIYGSEGKITGFIEIPVGGVILKDFRLIATQAIYGIYVKGASAVDRISDVTIENVRVSFASSTTVTDRLGIYSQYVDRLRVFNCGVDYGVYLVRCFNFHIIGNHLDGDNFQNENELLHCSVRSYGLVANNTFVNSKDNFIDLYPSGERTVIIGNRMIGCRVKTGAAIEIKVTLTDNDGNTSGGANDYGFVEQIIIANNYISNITAPSPIFISAISIFYLDSRAVPAFSWANTPRNILITGNIIDGFDNTLHASSTFCGVYLNTVNGVTISNNIMRNLCVGGLSSEFSAGVVVDSCRDVQIKNNRIALKDACGVVFHGACDAISTNENHMQSDLNAGYSLLYGIRIQQTGSFAAPMLTNCQFNNNNVDATISAFRQFATSGSILTDCQINSNVFRNEIVVQHAMRTQICSNKLEVSATRNFACLLGDASVVSSQCVVTGNIVKSPSGTPKTGISLYRVRASVISNNLSYSATYGLLLSGTNTAGECDNNVIQGNISFGQTQTNFPHYSAVVSADQSTIVADSNIKTS